MTVPTHPTTRTQVPFKWVNLFGLCSAGYLNNVMANNADNPYIAGFADPTAPLPHHRLGPQDALVMVSICHYCACVIGLSLHTYQFASREESSCPFLAPFVRGLAFVNCGH